MAGLNHQTEKQNISHQFLRCQSSLTQFTSLTAPHPQFQTPKCKHSFLNYPSRTKEEEEKTEQKGGGAFQSCWFRLWNICQRGKAPKVSPPGCGFVEISSTYSLLEPKFTSSFGQKTSVCPYYNDAPPFSPGLNHKMRISERD